MSAAILALIISSVSLGVSAFALSIEWVLKRRDDER